MNLSRILRPVGLGLLFVVSAYPQRDRLADAIDDSSRLVLRGHVPHQIESQSDAGPVDPSFVLHGLTLHFQPTADQQRELDRLLDDQQNPASPQFHKWLTPEDFADRFGLSLADAGKISAWLQSHGFRIGHLARGRQWIVFSGSAAQIRNAFHVDIRRYRVENQLHYANSADPSIPTALRDIVSALVGLDDFLPQSGGAAAMPENTSANGTHTLAPDDLAIIYDIMPLYKAGIDGSGQKIVIVGQSQVNLNDMNTFRRRFNLHAQNFRTVLVPDIGDPGFTGAQGEANLDLQWSGAVARNAEIIYVYSFNAYTAMTYAIDQNLAPVASASYNMGCEQQALSRLVSFRLLAQQANAQGITWVNSGGDTGAAACDVNGSGIAQNGLTVRFPASIPEVTAVGGTEFNEQGGKYWSPTNDANGASALSYIPEMVWNDSVINQRPSAGGGGASVFFPQPSWQTGPGVPANGHRNMPDVALASSAVHDGFNVTTNGSPRISGGTSAAAPSFAGLLALLNQYLVSTGIQAKPGLGNVNPRLYSLAQSAPSSFHDVVDGSNMVPCVSFSPDCSNGLAGYSAAPGYDQASGLGSPDFNNLIHQWSTQPASASLVAVSFDRNPVFQHDPDSNGFSWNVLVTLNEEAGVPTTLTALSVNGQTLDLAAFFKSTAIPANGSISAGVGFKTLSAPANVIFGFGGVDASGAPWSQTASLPFLGPTPVVRIDGVSNAASSQQGFAPGMLMSIYGSQLATVTQAAGAIPLIGFMGGISVTVDGITAPLHYVSPGQVNVQIPYEIPASGTARLVVNNGLQNASFTLPMSPSAPGIFVSNGFLVPFTSGARGQTYTLFITGEGSVLPFLLDGSSPPADTPIALLPKPVLPVSMTLGGVDAPIQFIGIASGLVGVTQINFTVPASVPLGVQPVVVKVGTASSSPANFTVTQ